MLVYGDPARRVATGPAVEDLRRRIAALDRMSPGLERHGELVGLFIEAAALWQGVADAEFEARDGRDDGSPTQDVLAALTMSLARAVAASWESGFEAPLPPLGEASAGVSAVPLPPAITVKQPEGYAFYGLYPEAYLAAAAGLPEAASVRVVGIRSIGTGLAAMIAVATGAPPPVTVRPVGPPFRRELSISRDILDGLAAGESAVAIADEGPGLSGSSFGAVADLLESEGVAAGRIHFFPSHDGDLGPEADPRHRARWHGAQRHVVEFEDLVLRAENPAHRLERWIDDLVGPLDGPLEDISAGGWRALRFPSEADWPAANVQHERRKFLARTEGGTFLVKFAGLGREGARKSLRAQALAAAGFSPEALGFRHGFLVERWVEGARPLDLLKTDRTALIEGVGRYLGFRARHFRADDDRGGSLPELWTMARHNAEEALGPGIRSRLDAWRPALGDLESRVRRIEIDGRLHAPEWLVMPGGRLLKTDALDHHAAHDLVGCQDVAWDLAGAGVEFALSDDEAERLRRVAEESSAQSVERDLVRFCTPCYLAFQLGSLTMAAAALAGSDEEFRLRRGAALYAGRLARFLGWGLPLRLFEAGRRRRPKA